VRRGFDPKMSRAGHRLVGNQACDVDSIMEFGPYGALRNFAICFINLLTRQTSAY